VAGGEQGAARAAALLAKLHDTETEELHCHLVILQVPCPACAAGQLDCWVLIADCRLLK
jgi:hypothetical protein